MGLTAYAGLHVVDALKGGETVWVSAAAGAVGSLAVQIAKLSGNRVIASAGTDDKVAWLRDELGVDAFNYRDGDLGAHCASSRPTGIDVYFDSVGGDHLEAALDAPEPRAAASRCAGRSRTTSPSRRARATCSSPSSKDLTLRGFRGSSNLHLLPEMQAQDGRRGCAPARWSIARRSSRGSTSAPRALAEMIAGHTTGKTLVSSDDMTRGRRTADRSGQGRSFLSGATGGLGRAMAERLAEEGAHLVLTDLDEQACQALAEELGGTPGRHLPRGSTSPTRRSGSRSPS